jgi:hypothetical protein
MYFPRNREFGSALSKLFNFGEGGLNPLGTPLVLYMNLESTRARDRPRNRWQDEVRQDGRIVGGEG